MIPNLQMQDGIEGTFTLERIYLGPVLMSGQDHDGFTPARGLCRCRIIRFLC